MCLVNIYFLSVNDILCSIDVMCLAYLTAVYDVIQVFRFVFRFVRALYDNGALFVIVHFVIPCKRVLAVIRECLCRSPTKQSQKIQLYLIRVFNHKSRFKSTKGLSLLLFSITQRRLQNKTQLVWINPLSFATKSMPIKILVSTDWSFQE